MQRIPTLVGIAGHFKGEIFPLQYGKTLSVGRSRTADFSLKRTEKYRAQTEAERDKDEDAQTVSSKHFQITMFNTKSIEIKNLSPNGTIVDGKPVETILIEDIHSQSHKIKFGTSQALSLEMRLHPD
jgi:hypothetical protein